MEDATNETEMELLMLRDGATVYVLGQDGTNRVSATVHTRPHSYEMAENVAELVRVAFNAHADLVAALNDEVRAMRHRGQEPSEATIAALAKAEVTK